MTLADLSPGLLIDDVVRLVRLLGQGGMGSIWVAEHLRLSTEVAVKFLSPSLVGEAGPLVRFQHEAMLAAQVKSPHVVQIFDQGVFAGERPYIVMELLEGEDLGHRLDRAGPLGLDDMARVVVQACRGLGKAHRLGIVHRDLKPDNVFLLDQEGELFVKVLDFGVAKRTDPARSMSVTDPGLVVGTPHYMSPEQMLEQGPLDHRADLWSLGVVAYRSLLGRLPFEGDTLGGVYSAIERGTFEPPSRVRGDVPPELDAWFLKALSHDLSGRFGSAREMAEALISACALGEPRSRGRLFASPGVTRDSWFALTPARPASRSPTSPGLTPAHPSLPSSASLGQAQPPEPTGSSGVLAPDPFPPDALPSDETSPSPSPSPSSEASPPFEASSPSEASPPSDASPLSEASPPSTSAPPVEAARPSEALPRPHRSRRTIARGAALGVVALVTSLGATALVSSSRKGLDRRADGTGEVNALGALVAVEPAGSPPSSDTSNDAAAPGVSPGSSNDAAASGASPDAPASPSAEALPVAAEAWPTPDRQAAPQPARTQGADTSEAPALALTAKPATNAAPAKGSSPPPGSPPREAQPSADSIAAAVRRAMLAPPLRDVEPEPAAPEGSPSAAPSGATPPEATPPPEAVPPPEAAAPPAAAPSPKAAPPPAAASPSAAAPPPAAASPYHGGAAAAALR